MIYQNCRLIFFLSVFAVKDAQTLFAESRPKILTLLIGGLPPHEFPFGFAQGQFVVPPDSKENFLTGFVSKQKLLCN